MDNLQDTVPLDKGGCCPALLRLVPVGFRAEARELFVLSRPLVLYFIIYVVSSVFCGHLSKVELASVTLPVTQILLLLRQDQDVSRGSACANTISQFVQTIFLFLYIVLKKLHLETWTGLLRVLDLSAQSIIYEVATVIYMISMGLSTAVCVRVGTARGASDTVKAKQSAISGVLCTVGTSLVVGALLSILKNKLGYIFTDDE
ncbi:Multidrug and toxin extrusion protein 2 [Pteropus alecto]|uniref:Multidrug and toxin extrusion protein 2 n=1 Tax=Pteropus alecto TaxID=9402 RepID=L5KXK3_PTEAL|nr:Multidrug and toxin extrusion protein 2 [Pteropus alecto]